MKRFSSVVTTIRIRVDQIQKINESDMNLSEFVREKLDEEFETQESLAEKETELLSELEKIKTKKATAKSNKENNIGNPSEEKFFKETKEILERDPGFLVGRWNKYKNDFRKTISLSKFEELIKK